MQTPDTIPTLPFQSAAAWQTWLAANTQLQSGIWLKIAKKATGIPTVTYLEALDVALCYGWIDGQKKSFDEQYFLQKFTPRRPKSLWSKVNIGKVEALTKAGLMQPAGLAAIKQAKADGRWEAAYESQANATVPPDLAAGLEADPAAKAYFDSLTKADQYAFLWRLMTAKTPVTRNSRLKLMLEMLSTGKQFH